VTSDTLKNRLLGDSAILPVSIYIDIGFTTELRIYRTSESNLLDENTEQVVHALPSMTLKMLRSRICKLLGISSKDNIKILMAMHDQSFITLTTDLDDHDLSWIGLESGSQLLCTMS